MYFFARNSSSARTAVKTIQSGASALAKEKAEMAAALNGTSSRRR